MGNVKEIGKFAYVEPNNLNQSLIDNGIVHPYEDYSMSVDLEVDIPSRFSFLTGEDIRLTFSSNDGTISFLGGSGGDDTKQGFLTTTYTDVSSNNVENGNKECLGIESITITYDSWFFPNVTIKFVDVRGASLFMPQEKNFYDKSGKPDNDTSLGNGGSFFKALFCFPYPLFKLRVKGFYGQEVTYKLSVSDFKADFNSQTGNFEATVQFIGYMYGLYADMPMTYLMVAPYLQYCSSVAPNRATNDYWENRKQSADESAFRYKDVDGKITSMGFYTFPELKSAVASAVTNSEKEVASSSEGVERTHAQNKINEIQKLKDKFPLSSWKKVAIDNSGSVRYYKILNSNDHSNNIISGDCSSILNYCVDVANFDTLPPSEGLMSSYESIYKSFITDITSAATNENINKMATKMPVIKIKKDGRNKISVINSNKLGITPNNTFSVGDFENEDSVSIRISDETKVAIVEANGNSTKNATAKELKMNFPEIDFESFVSSNISIYYIDSPVNFMTKLSQIQEEQDKIISKVNDDLNRLKYDTFSSLLGFNPTIQNIFEMTFAHMDTFINKFYDCINRCRDNKDKRTLSYLGITPKDTDVKGSDVLPPFTLFTKEVIVNGKKHSNIIWPGDLPGGKGNELDEVIFVNALINAAKIYGDENAKIDELLQNTNSGETQTASIKVDKVIPLTLYDYVNNDGNYNPYEQLRDVIVNDGSNAAEHIIMAFLLRAYYFYYTFCDYRSGVGEARMKKFFASSDLSNFKKCFPALPDTLAAKMVGLKGKEKEIIKYFQSVKSKDLEGKERGCVWNFPSLTQDSVFDNTGVYNTTYDWIKNGNLTYLPIGNVDIATIIGDVTSNKVTRDGIVQRGGIEYQNQSDKYIVLKNGEPVYDAYESNGLNYLPNSSTFQLITKSDFLSDLYTNIKSVAKDEDIKKAKSMLEKVLKEQTLSPIIDALKPMYWGDNTDMIFYSKNESAKTYTNFYHAKKGDAFGVVGDGTKVNGTMKNSVFATELYQRQSCERETNDGKNMFRKAYLYLYSVPIYESYLEPDNFLVENTETLYLLALREGAEYWRQFEIEQNNGEEIIYTDVESDIIMPATDELFVLKNQNTISFKTNALKNYRKVPEASKNSSRKYVLMNEFKKWASGAEFKEICTHCEYGKNGEKPITYENERFQASLCDLFIRTCTLISYAEPMSKENMAKGDKKASVEFLTEVLGKFLTYFEDFYEVNYGASDESLTKVETEDAYDAFDNDDFRLSTYLALKNLYDKWLCGNEAKKRRIWTLGDPISDFKNIKYIDSFYNNIGQSLVVNIDDVVNRVKSIMGNNGDAEYSMGTSFYEFLSETCQVNRMSFLALPIMYGLDHKTDINNVSKMFDAIPYNDMQIMKQQEHLGCTYVCLFAHDPSTKLKLDDESGEYGYENDSFDIRDLRGKSYGNPLPVSLAELDAMDDVIPAFGVTYAKQNQSYFKNISLSMNSHQVTDASIATTQMIANSDSSTPRQSNFYGQDLYRIYSNYSYDCTVDMMGNAQIMPLMYFQLNNIPMWEGAYMITRVQHTISAGKMETQFTGVRQSKNESPLVRGLFTVNGDNIKPLGGNTPNAPADNTKNDNMTIINGSDKSGKYTYEKPLIFVTPVHSNKRKTDEYEWSTTLVNDYIVPKLREIYGTDYVIAGVSYNNYSNTINKLISDYGSDAVISVAPHWNGGGGSYYGVCYKSSYGWGPWSKKLGQCYLDEALKISQQAKNGELPYLNSLGLNGMMSGKPRVLDLDNVGRTNVTDPAVKKPCAFVLAEQWFADYNNDDNTWLTSEDSGFAWLRSEEGLKTLASIHVNALKKYIKMRQGHSETKDV